LIEESQIPPLLPKLQFLASALQNTILESSLDTRETFKVAAGKRNFVPTWKIIVFSKQN